MMQSKMHIQKQWQAMVLSLVIVGGVTLSGCRSTTEAVDSEKSVSVKTAVTPPSAANATLKKAGASSNPGNAAKPSPTPTMTVTQGTGVGILKALNSNPAMKGHTISVGTAPNMVWLNGSVPKTAAARIGGENRARQGSKSQNRQQPTGGRGAGRCYNSFKRQAEA